MFKTPALLLTTLAAATALAPAAAQAVPKGPSSPMQCTYSFGVDEVTISDYDGSHAETHHYLVLYKSCGVSGNVEVGKVAVD